MATLTQRISALSTRAGTEIKAVRTYIGDKTSLTTTSKTSLVSAINEVNGKSGGAPINDAAASGTSVYSSSKTSDLIATSKAEILGGVGSAQDTLAELKAYIDGLDTTNDSEAAAMLVAIGNRLRFDASQTLTSGQKTQGNANLGSAALADTGVLDTDYVAIFEAGLL